MMTEKEEEKEYSQNLKRPRIWIPKVENYILNESLYKVGPAIIKSHKNKIEKKGPVEDAFYKYNSMLDTNLDFKTFIKTFKKRRGLPALRKQNHKMIDEMKETKLKVEYYLDFLHVNSNYNEEDEFGELLVIVNKYINMKYNHINNLLQIREISCKFINKTENAWYFAKKCQYIANKRKKTTGEEIIDDDDSTPDDD